MHICTLYMHAKKSLNYLIQNYYLMCPALKCFVLVLSHEVIPVCIIYIFFNSLDYNNTLCPCFLIHAVI